MYEGEIIAVSLSTLTIELLSFHHPNLSYPLFILVFLFSQILVSVRFGGPSCALFQPSVTDIA